MSTHVSESQCSLYRGAIPMSMAMLASASVPRACKMHANSGACMNVSSRLRLTRNLLRCRGLWRAEQSADERFTTSGPSGRVVHRDASLSGGLQGSNGLELNGAGCNRTCGAWARAASETMEPVSDLPLHPFSACPLFVSVWHEVEGRTEDPAVFATGCLTVAAGNRACG